MEAGTVANVSISTTVCHGGPMTVKRFMLVLQINIILCITYYRPVHSKET